MPAYPTNQSKWILWRKKNWSHGTVCSRPFFCFTYCSIFYISSYRWNPTYKFLIRSGSYRKVPIAVIEGQQINGSDEIVSTLFNKDFVKEALEKKWKQTPDMTLSRFINGTSSTSVSSSDKPTTVQYWTTEFSNDLAAILYPNIAATWSDSYQMFRYVDEKPNSFSYMDKFLIRNIGSLAMTMAASKIKSMSFSFSSWFNLQRFYFSSPFTYIYTNTINRKTRHSEWTSSSSRSLTQVGAWGYPQWSSAFFVWYRSTQFSWFSHFRCFEFLFGSCRT